MRKTNNKKQVPLGQPGNRMGALFWKRKAIMLARHNPEPQSKPKLSFIFGVASPHRAKHANTHGPKPKPKPKEGKVRSLSFNSLVELTFVRLVAVLHHRANAQLPRLELDPYQLVLLCPLAKPPQTARQKKGKPWNIQLTPLHQTHLALNTNLPPHADGHVHVWWAYQGSGIIEYFQIDIAVPATPLVGTLIANWINHWQFCN